MPRKQSKPKRAYSEYYFPKIDNPLKEADVLRVAGELRADRGSPEEARGLLKQFVSESYSLEGPSYSLRAFVRDALAEHLALGSSLESAFRLKKGRRGRPKHDTHRCHAYAIEFLRRRVVNGETFEDAALNTAEMHHTSRSVVCDAFSSYKAVALNALLEPSNLISNLGDPDQRARILAIYPNLSLPVETAVIR